MTALSADTLLLSEFVSRHQRLDVCGEGDITHGPAERDGDEGAHEGPSLRDLTHGGVPVWQVPHTQKHETFDAQPGVQGRNNVGEQKIKSAPGVHRSWSRRP